MATGGHFGFWLLTNSAANFARVMGAKFFSKYFKELKSSVKPYYALSGHGTPDCTQLVVILINNCSLVLYIVIPMDNCSLGAIVIQLDNCNLVAIDIPIDNCSLGAIFFIPIEYCSLGAMVNPIHKYRLGVTVALIDNCCQGANVSRINNCSPDPIVIPIFRKLQPW